MYWEYQRSKEIAMLRESFCLENIIAIESQLQQTRTSFPCSRGTTLHSLAVPSPDRTSRWSLIHSFYKFIHLFIESGAVLDSGDMTEGKKHIKKKSFLGNLQSSGEGRWKRVRKRDTKNGQKRERENEEKRREEEDARGRKCAVEIKERKERKKGRKVEVLW